MSNKSPDKPDIDDATIEAQSTASHPAISAWVSANAGSGKTHVLTQRVVRLLLAGCDPSRILCLTFTNAAAAEMSIRVFGQLSDWAVMDENALAELLEKLIEERPKTEEIREARRLFARALETPGGLKIQTIHAFCEALLHQFPLEANIAGHFDIIDELAQQEMIADAQRQVILAAGSGEKTTLASAFSNILAAAGDQRIEKTFGEAIKKRHLLTGWISGAGGPGNALQTFRRRWNFGPGETPSALIEEAYENPFSGGSEILAIADACDETGVNSNKDLAIALRSYVSSRSAAKRFAILEKTFLTKELKPRASVYTKKLVNLSPESAEAIDREVEYFTQTRDRNNLLKQIEASEALFTLTEAITSRYEAMKAGRGLLDFDDLIMRTAELLQQSDAAPWVQYKLDQGIDHVLVDEAQDTNPHQWRIIRSMVDDFFSGEGARDIVRTVFAVGDEKQSIYSFQGAEPKAFADQRDYFAEKIKAAGKIFESVELKLSFRSTPDVLSAVDEVFSRPENYNAISRDHEKTIHDTIRHRHPGMVDIWPMIKKEVNVEPDNWALPVDHLAENDPQVALAIRIADKVAGWISTGRLLEGQGRPIRAGDVLVLVRSRDRFATALTRELKARNVPVAGSDRLKLGDHIAVQDLLALGRVVLLPDDDLSLAAVLKSPLFGFDEDLLFELAADRGDKSIHDALQDCAAGNSKAQSALDHLQLLRDRADQMPVYEFYSLLLGRDGGRRKLLARLGEEAEDVLDAFIAQTLEHEQNGLPGLENFIFRLQSSSPDIKREFNAENDEVRIMTVHAAKGLEAPIVFIVDKGQAAYNGRHDPLLAELEIDGPDNIGYLWMPDKKNIASISNGFLDRIREDAEAEYLRLLYVAMTRAEDRLIICGTYSGKNPADNCWHTVVSNALCDASIEHCDDDDDVLFYRWQTTRNPKVAENREDEAKPAPVPFSLPEWIDEKLPAQPPLPRPLTPSGALALIDARVAQRETRSPFDVRAGDPSFALVRGTAIHRLLQTLPDIDPPARREAAKRYLAAAMSMLDETAASIIIDQVFAVIENDAFSPLFAAGASQAEVALSGSIDVAGKPRLVTGQIDRLVVGPHAVTIVDYKTNRPPPSRASDIPEAYIVQLALYRHLVARIYPDKAVNTALLWTETPQLMFVPETLIDQGFAKITQA